MHTVQVSIYASFASYLPVDHYNTATGFILYNQFKASEKGRISLLMHTQHATTVTLYHVVRSPPQITI